jgi:hypothetical protein
MKTYYSNDSSTGEVDFLEINKDIKLYDIVYSEGYGYYTLHSIYKDDEDGDDIYEFYKSENNEIRNYTLNKLLNNKSECTNCHKDYCDCRKIKKEKKIEEVKQFLLDNEITYELSNIPNVILVKNYYISLKKYRGCFKIKEKGYTTWKSIKPKTLLDLFK